MSVVGRALLVDTVGQQINAQDCNLPASKEMLVGSPPYAHSKVNEDVANNPPKSSRLETTAFIC